MIFKQIVSCLQNFYVLSVLISRCVFFFLYFIFSQDMDVGHSFIRFQTCFFFRRRKKKTAFSFIHSIYPEKCTKTSISAEKKNTVPCLHVSFNWAEGILADQNPYGFKAIGFVFRQKKNCSVFSRAQKVLIEKTASVRLKPHLCTSICSNEIFGVKTLMGVERFEVNFRLIFSSIGTAG